MSSICTAAVVNMNLIKNQVLTIVVFMGVETKMEEEEEDLVMAK